MGGAGLANLDGGGGPRQVGRGQDGVVRSRRRRSGLSEPGRGGRSKRRRGRMGEWDKGGMATQGAELREVRSIVVTGGGNGESPLSAPRTAARGWLFWSRAALPRAVRSPDTEFFSDWERKKNLFRLWRWRWPVGAETLGSLSLGGSCPYCRGPGPEEARGRLLSEGQIKPREAWWRRERTRGVDTGLEANCVHCIPHSSWQ